jgi:branched-chain amino acid aminotransferase
LQGILALKEAQSGGADDVLLLDQNGFATETSGANVFIVRAGTVYTPPVASVLEGITRDTIMTLAAEIGCGVAERPLTREDIYLADEAFLTGTAAEVAPVGELDGRRIGDGSNGPITSRLQAMYSAHVRGRGERHQDWLTAI